MINYLKTHIIRHFLTKQFIKFLFVGVTAAGLHWLARFYLDYFMSFNSAVIIAYAIGMLTAFILNAVFVFPDSERSRLLQCRDFTLINIAFFPVVWALSLLFRRLLQSVGGGQFSDGLAHAMAIAVPMVATFLFYKFFAFKTK